MFMSTVRYLMFVKYSKYDLILQIFCAFSFSQKIILRKLFLVKFTATAVKCDYTDYTAIPYCTSPDVDYYHKRSNLVINFLPTRSIIDPCFIFTPCCRFMEY